MSDVDDLQEDSDSARAMLSASAESKQTRRTTKRRRVLVIEDDDVDFEIIERSLLEARGLSFRVEHATRLSDGLKRLDEGGIHLVLLDLGLPDSQGLETFERALSHSPDVPIIVLSGLDDQAVAGEAVSQGAQDYLVKGKLGTDLLIRSIGYARARHKTQAKLTRALQLAQANEEKYRDLFDHAGDLIQSTAPDGALLYVNPAWKMTLGYTDKDVPKLNLFDIIHPDNQGLFQRALAGEDLKRIEATFVSREGRAIHVEGSSSCRFEDGKPVAARGIFRDVTDRKRSERERIKRAAAENEIRIARDVQQSLFPSSPPTPAGLDIAGTAFPADKASGDYFDFISLLDDRVGVIVGDVSGHGVGPAMMMVQTQAYMRAFAQSNKDISEILAQVNQLLCANESGLFVSLFFACLDPRTRSLTFASAGHRAYLLHENGEVINLDATGTPLAIQEDERFEGATTVSLQPGDLILIPTDGIQEAISPDNIVFGIERPLDIVRAHRHKPADEIVATLCQAARKFSGGPQADDITAVVIKVLYSNLE